MELPLTLAEAAKLIKTRTVSPVELTQAVLRRIEARDGAINAFNTVVGGGALRQARDAERKIVAGHYSGPIHGIFRSARMTSTIPPAYPRPREQSACCSRAQHASLKARIRPGN